MVRPRKQQLQQQQQRQAVVVVLTSLAKTSYGPQRRLCGRNSNRHRKGSKNVLKSLICFCFSEGTQDEEQLN
jgi:hypothetical protein